MNTRGTMQLIGNNTGVPMSRRIFAPGDISMKRRKHDDACVRKLVYAWDVQQSAERVLEVFIKYEPLLSDQRYWEILRTVWILCGNVQNVPRFRQWMTANRPHRGLFSTPEERSKLNFLPDEFDVFRACDDPKDGGISYTLDYQYALHYAAEFKRKQVVAVLVKKADVYALIDRNREDEILILDAENLRPGLTLLKP